MRKPIPAGFTAQPRDMATRPSPMTSANMAKAARKSSIVGVNPSDSAALASCAKTGIGSRIAKINTIDTKPDTPNTLGVIIPNMPRLLTKFCTVY